MDQELPDKLSNLLELALADLAKVEADKRYVVNMDLWHIPTYGGDIYPALCRVCLAGAVIAGSLGGNIRKHLVPYNFDEKTKSKLFAIDCLRSGMIDTAIYYMKQKRPKSMPNNIKVADYKSSPLQWLSNMLFIIALLREHGL